MKKFTAIPILMLLTAGVILSGCSDNKDSPAENASADAVPQTEYVMQDGDTQITGEVVQIIGNEVTLALGDVSGNTRGNGDGSRRSEDRDPTQTDENGESVQRSEERSFPKADENGEDFQRSDDRNFSREDESGDGFQRREKGQGGYGTQGSGKGSSVSIEKSGETNSYIIPVGMTVTGANGRNHDYSSVSAGMILQLTLNSDGYVVAAEIL